MMVVFGIINIKYRQHFNNIVWYAIGLAVLSTHRLLPILQHGLVGFLFAQPLQ